MYTASTAFLEALHEAGVEYIFANLGTDHPSLIESIAEARATGRPLPRVITCPNEMVALSAAHGFAQTTGRAQAVVVHVDCGTQALGGALHNAAKGRVPVLIFAGASPFTQQGEMPGSRNNFIQWYQDVFDQRGLVRGYVKYDNEIRTGRNIKEIVHRAMQIAHSEPKGPVYLVAAREALAEEISPVMFDTADWTPIEPGALPPPRLAELGNDLMAASRPLVITSYLGRNPRAVDELVRLCGRLAVGVLESVPNFVNFPSDHPLYQGSEWTGRHQTSVFREADVILVLDSDVPWVPIYNRPRDGARIYHIDVDPLKEGMPLWHIPAKHVFRADTHAALRQLNEHLDGLTIDTKAVESRKAHYAGLHALRGEQLLEREQPRADAITPEYLTACIRRHVDADTIVISEGVTNYKTIFDHLSATRPASLFASGASSLGWHGGAAIGARLAHPDKTVVALAGDGSYLFSAPSSVHWMAKHYDAPFLQVIYNNRGWKATKLAVLSAHPSGYASQAEDIDLHIDPPPDYAGIAAASGAGFAQAVRRPEELDPALDTGMNVVRREKRGAVLDVWLPRM